MKIGNNQNNESTNVDTPIDSTPNTESTAPVTAETAAAEEAVAPTASSSRKRNLIVGAVIAVVVLLLGLVYVNGA